METNKMEGVPFLQVADACKSAAYYCGILGFQKAWEHQLSPNLPTVVAIHREGFRLFLTEHPESAIGALVYVYVDSADSLYEEFTRRGVQAEWAPTDMPWGMREMQVRDPDGNKLRFGSPLREPEA